MENIVYNYENTCSITIFTFHISVENISFTVENRENARKTIVDFFVDNYIFSQ